MTPVYDRLWYTSFDKYNICEKVKLLKLEDIHAIQNTEWSKKNACFFSNNCNFVYFQYTKIMLTSKKRVINAVLITYTSLLNYGILQGGGKRKHVFQVIVTLFIFNIKKIMFTPKKL